jgi:hypothetical protein
MFATELQQVWSPIWRRLRGDLASSRRLRDSLRTREILLLTKRLQGEHRAFFNASFDTRLAEARARVDARLALARADAQAHLVQAEKKLSKAFAARVEDSLPTFGSGSQWWVDPIIGLWGQVNFTRWLFLAVQGDVGDLLPVLYSPRMSRHRWESILRAISSSRVDIAFSIWTVQRGFIYNAGEYGLFTGIGVKL